MAKTNRSIVVLNIPRHVPDLVKYAQNVSQSMANNMIHFASSNPPLADVNANITALDAAETVTQTKVKGSVEIRDVKLANVVSNLNSLKAIVQQQADANPAEAEVIIQSAGMQVRKPYSRKKPDFEARQGEVSGTVQLIVRAAGPNVAYEWQQSTDQKAWTPLGITLIAKTHVERLTSAITYSFRYRVVKRGGDAEWSQIVSMLVK